MSSFGKAFMLQIGFLSAHLLCMLSHAVAVQSDPGQACSDPHQGLCRRGHLCSEVLCQIHKHLRLHALHVTQFQHGAT